MTRVPFDPNKQPNPRFERAPDLAQAVEGWRAWRVEREPPAFGIAPRLYSVSDANYYWAPRRFSQAECTSCGENLPGEHCSCGFYSAKTLRHLMDMGYPTYDPEEGEVTVLGQVANWGKVVEGSQGWRAQKAYPVRLWVPYECWRLAASLRSGYGVPVRLAQWLTGGMPRL
jgi:hypothetical protein